MQALREFAIALVDLARAAYHRQVVVITGEHDWCLRQAAIFLEQSQLATIIWLGDRSPIAAITPLNARHAFSVLGKEIDALVVDAWDGFDPDAFGATIGAVHGGGLVLLLAPPLAKWPDYADPATDRITAYPYTRGELPGRYLKRLVRVIHSSAHALVLEPDHPLPRVTLPTLSQHGAATRSSRTLPTPDQQRAIAAIERCARGHRHRPVVLTSDRGRGKSAALGIAAARLLHAGCTRIIVTAPSLAAATTVFTHARCLMPAARAARGHLSDGGGKLEFMAPDALLRRSQAAELLLVDEAAAISTAVLSTLLRRYPRIVFASTVHGYEGSGRGFALRFRQVLDRHTPGWREYWLEAPIRWAADDPAERFAFQALLLNALPAPQAALVDATAGRCRLERLDR
ncbi:MAG: tRNA(Met) cytidine acetyltransferase, partial [Nitrococcus mobilis]|nr:tRNA(Met) cytidine acetyltransferase [Nitrococcus mobilis]